MFSSKRINRNSNMELLRIIAMFMIILAHIVSHGGGDLKSGGILAQVEKSFQICGGKFGVAIFVIIGSYYMQTSARVFERTSNVWLHTFLISLFSNVAILIMTPSNTVIVDLVKDLFPILHSNYWFVSVYFALIFISPFINYSLECFQKKTLTKFVIVLSLFFCIIPTLGRGMDHYLNEMIWFIYLYILTYYFRNNIESQYDINKRKFLILSIGAFSYIAMAFIIFVGGEKFTWIRSSGSVLILLSSFSIFILFKSFKERHSKVVTMIAYGTFTAYLIHDGPLREYIWTNVFQVKRWIDSEFEVLISIAIAFFIILFSTMLELLIFSKLFKVFIV